MNSLKKTRKQSVTLFDNALFNEDELLTMVKEAVSCIDTSSEKVRILGTTNVTKFDILTEILQYSSGPIEGQFMTLRYSPEFYKAKIRSVLKSLKKEKRISLKKFENEIKKAKEDASKAKSFKYVFIFPLALNIHRETPLGPFYIDKIKIEVIRHAEFVRSNFYSDNIQQLITLPNQSFFYDTWAVLKTDGRDEQFALQEAYQALLALLAICNFSLWHRQNLIIQFPPLRYSELTEPPFVLVYESKNKFKKILGKVSFFKRVNLDRAEQQSFLDIYNLIKKLPSCETKQRIIEVLKIYHFALIDSERDTAFLKFWSAAEFASLKTKKDQNQFLKRSRLVHKPGYVFNCQLKVITEKRNLLVHTGKFGLITLQDVNFAKSCCENFLWFLIYHCKKFRKLDQIETVYSNLGKNTSTLKETKKVLSFLLKEKQPK